MQGKEETATLDRGDQVPSEKGVTLRNAAAGESERRSEKGRAEGGEACGAGPTGARQLRASLIAHRDGGIGRRVGICRCVRHLRSVASSLFSAHFQSSLVGGASARQLLQSCLSPQTQAQSQNLSALGSRLARVRSAGFALAEGGPAGIALGEGGAPSGSRLSAEKPSPSAKPSEMTLWKRFLSRRTLCKRSLSRRTLCKRETV